MVFQEALSLANRGPPYVKNEVPPLSVEAMAIANYFYEAMPENTELSWIERWECKQLFYLTLPHGDFGSPLHEVLFGKIKPV